MPSLTDYTLQPAIDAVIAIKSNYQPPTVADFLTINEGEITNIYFTTYENTFKALSKDWTNKSDWESRLNQSNPNSIRKINVIGAMPAANLEVAEINTGETTQLFKTFSVNFTYFDTSIVAFEFIRYVEKHNKYNFWLATKSLMFGGNNGIFAQININTVINNDRKGLVTIEGNINWKSKYSPLCVANPLNLYDYSYAIGCEPQNNTAITDLLPYTQDAFIAESIGTQQGTDFNMGELVIKMTDTRYPSEIDYAINASGELVVTSGGLEIASKYSIDANGILIYIE